MMAIVRKVRERANEGKETEIYYRGRLVSSERIERFEKRFGNDESLEDCHGMIAPLSQPCGRDAVNPIRNSFVYKVENPTTL